MGPRVDFRRWSITSRLTFLFAVSSLVLVAVLGIYLYQASDDQLDHEITELLADMVDSARAIVARQEDAAALMRPHFWNSFSEVDSRLHVRITDEQDKVLVATSALDIPAAQLPPPAANGERANKPVSLSASGGRRYRVVSGVGAFGVAGEYPVRIVLALDVTAEQRRLGAYHRTLFGALLVGALSAAALGYFIVRRGLAPLRRIAKRASEITSARLEKKLALDDAPAELRDLVAAFNGMLDRLHDSFSRLSQFSSDIAHELRTPVNNLMGEAQVALSRARTAQEYREALESIVEEYERLSRMIESMLFLARADDPQTKISAVPIDARVELEKICEFYEVVADDSGVSLRCDGNGTIFADPLLFRRAIGNLLSNALRHTPRDGEIVLEVHMERDGAATTTVTNPGAGIAAQHLVKIFDRLYRIDTSREKTIEGSGLGLAIVKSIMELHRGTVNVTSTPGGLTVFRLRFPPVDASA
ncbi:MAG: histidine kinase [Betaproteobacteria bacterium]|nr:histidine kinase [Betaproteobacteria bacterium]